MDKTLFHSKWFQLAVGGILTILLSVFLFGGALHCLLVPPVQWWTLAATSTGAVASFITGLLMMFDAAECRMETYIDEAIKAQQGEYEKETERQIEEEEKRYIDSLIEKSESLRPEHLKSKET